MYIAIYCLNTLLKPYRFTDHIELVSTQFWRASCGLWPQPLCPLLTTPQPHSHLSPQAPVLSSIPPLKAPCKLSVEMAPHWGLCSYSTAPLDTRWWGLASSRAPGTEALLTGLREAPCAKVCPSPLLSCPSSAAGGVGDGGPRYCHIKGSWSSHRLAHIVPSLPTVACSHI